MKQKLLYLLPLFLLSGCGQATYKNASLPAEERAGLLLKELTLEEKVSLMMDSSKPVERLGIKPYNWWNEALHGVARAGGQTGRQYGQILSNKPILKIRKSTITVSA